MIDVATELRRPEFWALHYEHLAWDPRDGSVDEAECRDPSEVIQAAFGFSGDHLSHYYELIDKPEAEAYLFSVPVLGEYDVGIQEVHCGEDWSETRYSVGHAQWPEREQLGQYSGNFALPAFRWAEVELIARAIEPRSPDDAARAILLLFPSVYLTEADEPGTVERTLTEAWTRIGLPAKAIDERLLHNAVEYQSVPDLAWTCDPELGWINNWPYSFRNPETLMTRFQRRRFDRVRAFMAAVVDAVRR